MQPMKRYVLIHKVINWGKYFKKLSFDDSRKLLVEILVFEHCRIGKFMT